MKGNQTYRTDQLLTRTGLNKIKTCEVQHIENSFGISLSVQRPNDLSTFKLTYSGDTRPCKDLIALGEDSTVLIHEATFTDDVANHEMHSTVSQAVTQGIKMNAKYTILTHFKGRYQMPQLNRPLPHNVTCAFDNMELVESDLTISNDLHNVIRSIHQEQMGEYDARAVRQKFWKKKNQRNSVSSN